MEWPDITDRLEIDPSAYIHPRAYVGGTVRLGALTSVWPMAVIRGDEGTITIGARCNVQDGCVIHADPTFPVLLGDDCTLGHRAVVHGATLEDGVLIGMGAIVLNGARIGAGSVVGAGALVPEGMDVPPQSLVLGVPGTLRPLRPEQAERSKRPARNYVELAQLYAARDAEQRP